MKYIGYESYTSWLVTVGCCIIACLSATPYRLAGLIYVLTIEYYDTDRETASIPILMFLLIRCLGGPVFSVLGEKFGLELITLIGCLLAAVGFGACFYAQNIVGVILLLGIVYGVGLAFSNTFAPNIVKKYFTKNFSTANGIAYAGSCLGAILIPPAATFLIDLYGVSGAFLILSGIMLNGIPLGIYILIAGAEQDKLIKHQAHKNEIFKNKEKTNVETKDKHENDIVVVAIEELSGNIQCVDGSESLDKGKKNVSKVAHNAHQSHKQHAENLSKAGIYEKELGFVTKNEVNLKPFTQNKDDSKSLLQTSMNTATDKAEKEKNTANIPPSLQLQNNAKNKRKKIYHGFSVFKDISFLMILLNVGLGTYATTLFWTTMIDYSRDKGISSNLDIYFLMLPPLFDLIGRICFGWVTDLGYLTLSTYGMLCYGQMALSMFIVIWTKSFWVMLVGACSYALASGAITSAYPGMIFKCVDKDHQTMAIASRHSLYGALVFTSSPLIGYFRENLGSYDGLYCLFIALCLVCAAIIPFMFKFSKHAKATTPMNEE